MTEELDGFWFNFFRPLSFLSAKSPILKDRPFQLPDIVRETGYAIHCHNGGGHLEKVYENAVGHRLRKLGLKVEQQRALTVCDEDGTVIGEYFADLPARWAVRNIDSGTGERTLLAQKTIYPGNSSPLRRADGQDLELIVDE